MATYRLWPATNGPAAAADTNGIDIANEFYVTQAGCNLDGYFWWLPTGGDTTGANYSVRLYSTTNGTTGTLITGTSPSVPNMTAGAWNFIPLATPVALVANTRYRATITHAAGTGLNAYGATASYWTTGGGGAAGIVNGPLNAPNSGSALSTVQSSFNEPTTGGMPLSGNASENLWIDVQVDTGTTTATVTPPPVPPGRKSPAAWSRLIVAQASQAPPLPPPPAQSATPPPLPPGRQSPAAWSRYQVPRASQPPPDFFTATFTSVFGGPETPGSSNPVSPAASPPPGRQSPMAWSGLRVPRVPQPAAVSIPAAASPPPQVPQPRRVPTARARTGRSLVAAGLIGTAGVTTGHLPPPGLPRISHPAPHRALTGTGRGVPPAALPQPSRPVTVFTRTAHRVLWRGAAVAPVTAVQGTGTPQPSRPVTVFRRTPHPAAWRAVTGQPPAAARQPRTPATIFTRTAHRVLWRGGQGPAVVPVQGGTPQPFRPVTIFRRAPHRAAWQAGAGKPPAAARQPRTPATVFTRPPRRALWRAGTGSPAPPPPPFTVGRLTASDQPGSLLTAATAAGSTLTATSQRTGGPS